MIMVDLLMGCAPNRSWKWGQACHLFTDSEDLNELHAFAKRIGLKREWFQDHELPHYDLTRGKRIQAINAGAMPVDAGKMVEVLNLWRERKKN
jgi:hypothetical protein